jgi:hypothetical protein
VRAARTSADIHNVSDFLCSSTLLASDSLEGVLCVGWNFVLDVCSNVLLLESAYIVEINLHGFQTHAYPSPSLRIVVCQNHIQVAQYDNWL